MAAPRSILSAGRTASRSAHEAQEPTAKEQREEATAALVAALQAQIDQLTQRCVKSDSDLSAARAETAAARDRLEAVRADLLEEAHQVSLQLAAEQAVSAGLRGELEAERRGRAAMQQALDQAVRAAAERQAITFPKHEPIAYEVLMVDPETGARKQVSIKPAKKA